MGLWIDLLILLMASCNAIPAIDKYDSKGNIKFLSRAQHFLQDCMCAQRKPRSVHSDQSIRCPLEDAMDSWLPTGRSAKTLIRLRGCTG